MLELGIKTCDYTKCHSQINRSKNACAQDWPTWYSIQTSARWERSGRQGAARVKRAAGNRGAELLVQEGRPERFGVKVWLTWVWVGFRKKEIRVELVNPLQQGGKGIS